MAPSSSVRPRSRHKRSRVSEQKQHCFTCLVNIFQAGNPRGVVVPYRKVYNLQRFRAFLDRRWPLVQARAGQLGAWLYVNVYTKLATADTPARGQLGSFTRRGSWPPPRPYSKFGTV